MWDSCVSSASSSVHGFRCRWRSCWWRWHASRISSMRWNICVCPSILTTIIAFLYRYLFVLADEVFRLMRARESRSAAVPGQRSGGSVAWRAGVAGIWQVNFSCGVTSAVTASTMPCWRAATRVTCRRSIRMSFAAVITSRLRLRCWQSFSFKWLDGYDKRFTSSRSAFFLS